MRINRSFFILIFTLTALGCSTTQSVDKAEPKRVLGREADVRLDAQIFSDRLNSTSSVEVRYEIENFRSTPIAIPDLIPETTYDLDTRTITVKLGSEVPGNEFLPRLVRINSGEKKTFSVGARFNLRLPSSTGPFNPYPRYLRIQLHFLGDTAPFEQLIDIPEKSVRNPDMATAMFPTWVENLESVTTNSIPIEWGAAPDPAVAPDAGSRGTTRRRRPGGPM